MPAAATPLVVAATGSVDRKARGPSAQPIQPRGPRPCRWPRRQRHRRQHHPSCSRRTTSLRLTCLDAVSLRRRRCPPGLTSRRPRRPRRRARRPAVSPSPSPTRCLAPQCCRRVSPSWTAARPDPAVAPKACLPVYRWRSTRAQPTSCAPWRPCAASPRATQPPAALRRAGARRRCGTSSGGFRPPPRSRAGCRLRAVAGAS
mmetsp:Transcript_41959/g.118738  ORF Transcript_41959/g.118738 Transcript_41959/m.118738 type:complete len:202 (-) Transcript_41959:2283-2888(-)